MTEKYLPSQLKNIVKDFRIAKDIDSCEVITHQGKRCKNATKYRFGDEIKDCGTYCAKHCSLWAKDLILSLIYGDIIIDGNKPVKKRTIIIDFEFKSILENNGSIAIHTDKSVKDFEYHRFGNENDKGEFIFYDRKENEKKVFGSKQKVKSSRLEDLIEFSSKKICSYNKIKIKISVDNKLKKMKNLEIGGIKGWKISHFSDGTNFEKTYSVDLS